MDENSFDFGSIVKRERQLQEISLKKLSENLGGEINPSYINRLETGKQTNPSFQVVVNLCRELNLDMREVFRTFGFESLIKDYDQDAVFSIEELIRLHKIKLPVKIDNKDELSDRYRLLNKEEQEQIIQLIYEVFDYGLSKETDYIKKLTSIIQQIQELREMQQKTLNQLGTFNVKEMDKTYTIQLDNKIWEYISDFEEWKKAVEVAIDNYSGFLRDYPGGIFTLSIDKQEWLVEKDNNILKFLFKKSEIVSLS